MKKIKVSRKRDRELMRKKGGDREALKIRDLGGWMGVKIEKDGDVRVDNRDYKRDPERWRSRGSHGSGNR